VCQQARRQMAAVKVLQLQDKPCFGALNVQAVLPFGFSLNSRKCTTTTIFPHELTLFRSRHAKIHSRPYHCRVQQTCSQRFAEKRDRSRHEAAHGVQARGIPHYFCPYDCERSPSGTEGGFGVREDNAKRHIRTRHNGSMMAPVRIIT